MLAFRKISDLLQPHMFFLLFDPASMMKPLYSALHPLLYQKAFHESGGQFGAPTHTSFIFSAGMGGIVLALMLFTVCIIPGKAGIMNGVHHDLGHLQSILMLVRWVRNKSPSTVGPMRLI